MKKKSNNLITVSRRAFAQRIFAGVPLLFLKPWQAVGFSNSVNDKLNDRCTTTEPMEIGPYYRAGSPWRNALCAKSERGRALIVSGEVRGEDTCAPLSDVIIDVWQADATGHYDFNDTPQPTTPSSFRLRGLMMTDNAGRYAFNSVIPGNYNSSPTQQRAKHIHYFIRRSGYEPLITQLYFEGDSWNTRDPLVRKSLVMPISETGDGGAAVKFDIVLRREKPLDVAALRVFEDYIGEYHDTKTDVTIKVIWRGGRLAAIFGKDDVAELLPRSNTSFLAAEWEAQLTFVRNEQGKVAELIGDLDDGRQGRLKKVR